MNITQKLRLVHYGILVGILTTTLPFFYLFSNLDFRVWAISRELFLLQLATMIGAVSGFIAMSLFLWQVILGSRQFTRMLTSDTGWSIQLHKWLGVYGSCMILLHPAMEMYAYGQNLLFLIWPDMSTDSAFHITLGRFALILFLLILFSSAVVRDKLHYRPWKYIHLLSYPMILLTFFHAFDIGSTLITYPVLNSLWYFLLVSFILFIVYRIYEASGVGSPRYVVTTKQLYGNDIAVLKLMPINSYLNPKPGQYVYIQLRTFGEAHPFSVMGYNQKTGAITLGIKSFGRFSQQIVALRTGAELRIDGPYGAFTQEAHNSEPVLFIAGGIGVTPFISVLEQYAHQNSYLINCNIRSENVIARNKLKQILGNRYIDVLSREPNPQTEPNVFHGRLSTDIIQSCIPSDVLQQARIYFCGPESLYEAVQRMCIDELGVLPSKLYYEEFSF